MSQSVPPTVLSTDHFFFGRRKLKGLSREDKMRMEIAEISDVPTAYRPVQNMFMIAPLPGQGQSEGGIILPNGSRVEYTEGHIVAMGPTCIHKFNVGDCVCWAPHQASKLSIEDVEFVLLCETAVLMYIPVNTLKEMRLRYAGACEHCNETGGHHKLTCPCHDVGDIYDAFVSGNTKPASWQPPKGGDPLTGEQVVAEQAALGTSMPNPLYRETEDGLGFKKIPDLLEEEVTIP